jgi:benzodiazapine receptor
MSESPQLNERIRSILVLIATAATIAWNILAAYGYVNGITPAEISDKYPTIITPAGYAFSIWSLIYAGLVVYSIYQALPGNLGRFGGLRTIYIASCVLNCAWIYFWHHDRPGICVFLIAALAAVLIYIVSQVRVGVTSIEKVFVKGTFGLYAGWVTAAAIVNLFVYFRSVDMPAADSATFGVLAVILATVFAIVVTWRLANFVYPLAIAWALTAIAIKQSGSTSLIVACAGGVIMSLLLATSFILSYPSMARPSAENE